MSYNYFQQTIVPSTTAWSIGTVQRPFKDIWLGFGSVNLANATAGLTGVALDNTSNIFTLAKGSAGLQILDSNNNTVFYANSAGNVTTYTAAASANSIGAFTINGSSSRTTQQVLNPGVMFHVTGNDNLNNRIVYDSFGSNSGVGVFPQLIGRTARGTVTTPTYTLSGDVIFRITANGYNALSGFTQPNGSTTSPSFIEAVATESFSGQSVGTEWRFYNATKGDVTGASTLDLVIDNTGVKVPVASAGITFGDGSFQNTAYVAPPSGTYAAQISGTWVPQISAAGYALSAVGYSGGTPVGAYIKTGRYVYCTFNISVSAFTGVSNSANLYLVNLPFAVENGPLLMPFGDLSVYRYAGLTGGGQGITGGNEGTSQGFTLYNIGPGSTVNLTPNIFSTPASMVGSLRYISS